MSRSLKHRIERLEGHHDRPGTPSVIVATCPIPDDEHPPSTETIERWLADGRAHVAFKGHTVLYDGGRGKLTIDEWKAQYCGGREPGGLLN
jgi:hypothetical protein